MSADLSKNSESASPVGPDQKAQEAQSVSYVQLTCSYCKFKKRKCSGGSPCSNCKKNRQTCVYFADNDRRRRKYHTDYIDYLEEKSDKLTIFISEFVKDLPQLSILFHEKLTQAVQASQVKSGVKDSESNSQMNDRFLELLSAATTLKLDAEDDTRVQNSNSLLNHSNEYEDINLYQHASPYTEATSSNSDAVPDEESHPLTMNGLNIVFKDEAFKTHLIDCFEANYAPHAHAFKLLLPSIRQWEFSSPVPSKQLLMCTVFAIGAIYSYHPYALSSRKAFIAEAEYIAINTCRYPLDVYLVSALSLLSAYELGMGNDSISYLFNSMACSLTQHMGLHISYDETQDSKSAKYAPRASPMASSILWQICLQDRIITSICNVQACIHFKRIIAPPYHTELGPENESYLSELCFAYQTRLWYIYDRFMDQICSENGDIGDTQQRTKLLETALNSMAAFRNSLPSPLILVNGNNNKHVIYLHYTYYSLICQFHKVFIKVKKNSIQALTQNAALAGGILAQYQTQHLFETLPYNASYLVYCNALVYLIFISRNKDAISRSKKDEELFASFTSHLRVCVSALTSLNRIWKRPKKDLKILKTLCLQSGVQFPVDNNEALRNNFQYDSGSQTPEVSQKDGQSFASGFTWMTSPGASSNAPSDLGADPLSFDNDRFTPQQQTFADANVPLPTASFQVLIPQMSQSQPQGLAQHEVSQSSPHYQPHSYASMQSQESAQAPPNPQLQFQTPPQIFGQAPLDQSYYTQRQGFESSQADIAKRQGDQFFDLMREFYPNQFQNFESTYRANDFASNIHSTAASASGNEANHLPNNDAGSQSSDSAFESRIYPPYNPGLPYNNKQR